MSKQFNIVSLFSGWGGGDLGFHRAFFQTLLAVDSDAHSRASFKLNFEDVDVQAWDLMTVKAAFILNHLGLTKLAIDVLLMSPPCTGISKAGKCDPFNILNLLFLRSIRQFIPGLLPRVFLIENVPMEGDMLVLYNMVEDELEKLKGEYHIIETTLNAIDFGSPQSRKRFFIMGVHKSLGIMPSFPEPTTPGNLRLRIKDVLPDVDGIAYGYGWKKFKHKSEELNTMTKTLNLRPIRNGEVGDFIVREVLDMGGYPLTWETTGSILQVWNRAGNSIMPDISFALARHIRDNILSKADTSILLLPDVKPTIVAPIITTEQRNAVNKPAEGSEISPAIPFIQDGVSPEDSVISTEQVPPALNKPVSIDRLSVQNKPIHNSALLLVTDKPMASLATSFNNLRPGKIISSAQLAQMEFEVLAFLGKWDTFFGSPSVIFQCIIHGMSGHGKSTFAIQFAKYLADNFGQVLYISGEEGFSRTLQAKLVSTNSESPNLYVAELKTSNDIIREVQPGKYRFIFIDSLNNMKIDPATMRQIRATHKTSAFIVIAQSTKGGDVRGSYEIIHDSDIVVSVDEGLATTTKNRFKEKGTIFNVFEIMPDSTATSN